MKEDNDLLSVKTRKVISVYTQAMGGSISAFDQNCQPLEQPSGGIEQSICQYCQGACGSLSCREMHSNAIREASQRGESHSYSCELGLLFWTSPIYSEGRFTGALQGSGFLSETADESVFSVKCKGNISLEEFTARITAFPRADEEKLISLAEMLLLCAGSLSTGNEDYHEILKRRSEQQQVLTGMIKKLKTEYPEGSALPAYPLDKEQQLFAALRKGDGTEAIRILNEILAALVFSNTNQFRYIQLRVMELVVLLSRVGNGSVSGNVVIEANARWLRQVQESTTVEELTDILHTIVTGIAEQISSFQGIPHAAALRKAELFIRENFTRKLSLREIAGISGLSAPYFSTIFKEEMGENLSKYINRLRLEKASRMLLETDISLSEIAGACCFEDQSWFSKIFKAYTGLSPGKYRSQGGGMVREISENNLSEDYLKTLDP
ncbi:MAG: helix-turn-helix domain-containing protein [Treponema sp.]|jgi:AraC-like DNA-binding protein/ligand-binding sensor protein|nr:helix-turn-helix domain-containing protein [Treponema sp.]